MQALRTAIRVTGGKKDIAKVVVELAEEEEERRWRCEVIFLGVFLGSEIWGSFSHSIHLVSSCRNQDSDICGTNIGQNNPDEIVGKYLLAEGIYESITQSIHSSIVLVK